MAMQELGLVTINDSDFVSPDPINQNFERVASCLNAYVVESGVSGDWWYRKWSDGRAECGVDCKAFAEKTFGEWLHTGLYAAGPWSFGAYPITFTSAPYVNVSFRYDSNMPTGRGSFVYLKASLSTTQSPDFHLLDASVQTPTKPWFDIYVSGRWM